MSKLVPFDWKAVEQGFRKVGYEVTTDDDGDRRVKKGSGIGHYVKVSRDDVTEEVTSVAFMSMFKVAEAFKESKEMYWKGVNALNSISSFCTFSLSQDETVLILSSWMPARAGVSVVGLRQIVSARQKVVDDAKDLLGVLVD